MNDRTNPSKSWNQNIIRNLRQTYSESIAKYTDLQLLKTYDDWNISDKTVEFTEWCQEWDS